MKVIFTNVQAAGSCFVFDDECFYDCSSSDGVGRMGLQRLLNKMMG